MKILITGGNGNLAKIIKTALNGPVYEITNPSRSDLNLLSFDDVQNYFNERTFDILIQTAIVGGRRTKDETADVVYKNALMFENLAMFSHKFKLILNFDSAAIYDRSNDILNRKEDELNTIPTDFYGFSKYLIYQRSLKIDNLYNLRIFNIFHTNEEPDRFIKSCFISKQQVKPITIFEDKYFDFVYEKDFIKIVKYYLDNVNTQDKLKKTINVCYQEKYRLSDIANMILEPNMTTFENIIILKNDSNNNYSGNGSLLHSTNLNLHGLKKSLELYAQTFTNK